MKSLQEIVNPMEPEHFPLHYLLTLLVEEWVAAIGHSDCLDPGGRRWSEYKQPQL